MPGVFRPDRQRRWHQKTFSGCVKCKQRRVKCDEARPHCRKCGNLGIQCPGYKLPLTRLFEPKLLKHPECSREERIDYDFFVQTGSRIVAASQSTSLPFWTEWAPRLAESDPAVKHVLITLGSLVRLLKDELSNETVNKRCTLESPPSAIRNATLAMQHMSSAQGRATAAETSVVYCILLRELAIWTGRQTSSHEYVLDAYNFLHTKNAPGIDKTSKATILACMIDQLLAHAATCTDDFPPVNSGLLSNYQLVNGLERVSAISTWNDAFDGISSLLQAVFRATCPYILSTDTELGYILCTLKLFDDKLQSLRAQSGLACDFLHLQVHHSVAQIMFNTLSQRDEWIYDNYQSEFWSILEHIKRLLAAKCIMRSNSETSLQPSLGLIPPLFLIATKCRHLHVRQQAAHILHDLRRAERVWTSCMATTIARFVIEEEKPVSLVSNNADVTSGGPQPHRRIRLDEVVYSNEECRIVLAYTAFSEYGAEGEHCTASLPFAPHPSMKSNDETCSISRKVLRHCGYSGILLLTPRIECHCLGCE
ncbi:uncharacterized protein PV06_09059 [Exophiala oligosperma]|uniref:Zn(2)-C6 fungal-type domain-containing protein n=2 Tax=Chaetothyriales TaxID=34395 RepID=A0A0D2D7Z5_9EURO|nr:uncharacterized protein PV06_09059 [Exophiala oligosperma]KAJ9643759.1 hypothetical protein H2204_001904 [Knufia peltigerae]KIW39273.1 hypothetical protein PV06_09059 [Exophiala oligosperma]